MRSRQVKWLTEDVGWKKKEREQENRNWVVVVMVYRTNESRNIRQQDQTKQSLTSSLRLETIRTQLDGAPSTPALVIIGLCRNWDCDEPEAMTEGGLPSAARLKFCTAEVEEIPGSPPAPWEVRAIKLAVAAAAAGVSANPECWASMVSWVANSAIAGLGEVFGNPVLLDKGLPKDAVGTPPPEEVLLAELKGAPEDWKPASSSVVSGDSK